MGAPQDAFSEVLDLGPSASWQPIFEIHLTLLPNPESGRDHPSSESNGPKKIELPIQRYQAGLSLMKVSERLKKSSWHQSERAASEWRGNLGLSWRRPAIAVAALIFDNGAGAP
jgi:hypothetical protein